MLKVRGSVYTGVKFGEIKVRSQVNNNENGLIHSGIHH